MGRKDHLSGSNSHRRKQTFKFIQSYKSKKESLDDSVSNGEITERLRDLDSPHNTRNVVIFSKNINSGNTNTTSQSIKSPGIED